MKKKISSHTFKTFFDKKIPSAKETTLKEQEFIDKYGGVDSLLDTCLNSSNTHLIDQLTDGAEDFKNLDKECNDFIERLIADKPDLTPELSPEKMYGSGPAVKMIRIGSIIDGRYEIKEYLGEGAFGEVYKGFHKILKIAIAIKTLKKSSKSNPQTVQRFIREAQIMVNIDHPNIIRIYDVGKLNGQLYLIMKHIDGIDLEKFIDREGRLEPVRAIEIMMQISDALSVIHNKGIIHRDIKPSNIMIDKSGRPILMDFGVAKDYLSERVDQKPLTTNGSFLGTPHYMAPEQFTNPEKVTKATDVYALGIVFYQLVSGKVPISGDTFGEIYQNHLSVKLPNVHILVRGISPRISKVISKMLVKDPGHRYPDGAAVRNALKKAKRSRTVSIAKFAAIIMAGVLAGSFAVRSIMIGKKEKIKTNIQIADSLITEGHGLAAGGRWNAAKSNYLKAYEVYKNLNLSTVPAEIGLWEVNRNSPSALSVCIRHPAPLLCMAMSFDDKLALSGDSEGTLTLWDVSTGQKLSTFRGSSDGVPKTCVALSSDGYYALSGSFNGEISLWAIKTGERIRSFGEHRSWLNKVVFTPNNRMALSADNHGKLILWDIELGEIVQDFQGHKDAVRDIAFTKDEKMIVSGGADRSVILWDIATGEIKGPIFWP